MARTSQMRNRKTWRIDYGIWFRNWKQADRIGVQDMKKHLKKLLVYYPKNIQALKILALEAQGSLTQQGLQEFRGLQKAVFAKYSKSYLRQIRNPPRKDKMTSATSIKLSISKKNKGLQTGMLRTVKRLNELDLSISEPQDHLIQSLKYIKAVTSLTLNYLADISLKYYESIFKHLKGSIKCLTLTGDLWSKSQSFSRLLLLEFLMSFPNLKFLRVEAGCDVAFHIGDIPLNILQQKGVKFDIRVRQSDNKTTFGSSKNNQALSSIEVLGLNSQKLFFSRSNPPWSQIEEAQLDIQKKTQGNLLWINYITLNSTILLNLFNAFKNISTLNLLLAFLSCQKEEKPDFSGLCELCNLKHVFVEFDSFGNPIASLFTGLGTLAKKHKKLEFVSFNFAGCSNENDTTDLIIQPFFDSSSQIIKKVLFKFSVDDNWIEKVPIFYQELEKLKQISSLSLLVADSYQAPNFGCPRDDFCSCHYSKLTDLFDTMNNLIELDLALPDIHNKELKIILPKSLEKLSLEIPNEAPWLYILKDLSKLANLQQFNLILLPKREEYIREDEGPIEEEEELIGKDVWTKLSKVFLKSEKLEILKLRFSPDELIIPIEDLIFLMKNKRHIKLILIEKAFSEENEYFIFTRKGCQPDIESFVRRGSGQVKTFPKKSFFFD